MKLHLLFFFFLTTFVSWSQLEESIPVAAPAEFEFLHLDEEEELDSLMELDRKFPIYKIERDNYPTSYLMGTIHIVPSKYAPRVEILQSIFENVSQTYLEIGNLNNINPSYYLLGKKDRDFLSYFNPEQQDSIFAFAAKHASITKGMLKINNARFKPLMLQQLLVAPFASGDYSYDLALNNLCREKNIPVYGLEEIEAQLMILNGQDSLSTNKTMMEFMREPRKMEQQYKELLYHYFSRNIDKMEQYIRNEYTDESFVYSILDKRNIAWNKKLKSILKKKPTFVAVGAGHLGGSNGLINLLQKQGFKIIPIEL